MLMLGEELPLPAERAARMIDRLCELELEIACAKRTR